jgi:phosphate uptake regulator
MRACRLWPTTNLPQLTGLCLAQVRAAIVAFVNLDPVLAGNVIADRELVTAAHRRVVTDLLSLMIEDQTHRQCAEGLLGIARELDMLGDQASQRRPAGRLDALRRRSGLLEAGSTSALRRSAG